MARSGTASVTILRGSLTAAAGSDTDRTVVWLIGEHDASTAGELSDVLARAIALHDDVVVDLSGVEFMDAATLGVIVRARDFVRLLSRSFAARAPSPRAQRMLDLCGLAGLVDPVPVTGATSALATWVAVPSTEPVYRNALRPAPEPRRASA